MASGDPLLSMFHDVLEMLALTRASFKRHDPAALDKAAALGRDIHKREPDITEQLRTAAPEREGLRFIPPHRERAGHAIEGLIRCVRAMETESTLFTDRGIREITQLFTQTTELLE